MKTNENAFRYHGLLLIYSKNNEFLKSDIIYVSNIYVT